MNRKILLIGIVLTACFLFPVAAKASNDVSMLEAKISIDGQELTLSQAEVLRLAQSSRVSVLVKLSKSQYASGNVRILTDLAHAEGPLHLDLADYRNQPVVLIKFTGTVPDALVQKGQLVRVGERAFTLVNIIIENNGSADTLFGIISVSTTPELQESALRVTQIKVLLPASSNDERSKIASNLILAATSAREDGDPTLAISLCNAAQQTLNLRLEVTEMPFWYLLIMLVIVLSLTGTILALVRKSNTNRPTGWIKPR